MHDQIRPNEFTKYEQAAGAMKTHMNSCIGTLGMISISSTVLDINIWMNSKLRICLDQKSGLL